MDIAKFAALPFRYRPWQPRHARLIAADLFRPACQTPRDHQTHLGGAIDWLCRAQDVRGGESDAGGVSAGWSFEDGWLPSYPETTGYIVETFLAAADFLKRPELITRAGRMIDWELSIQLSDGAFPGHFGEEGSQPRFCRFHLTGHSLTRRKPLLCHQMAMLQITRALSITRGITR